MTYFCFRCKIVLQEKEVLGLGAVRTCQCGYISYKCSAIRNYLDMEYIVREAPSAKALFSDCDSCAERFKCLTGG